MSVNNWYNYENKFPADDFELKTFSWETVEDGANEPDVEDSIDYSHYSNIQSLEDW